MMLLDIFKISFRNLSRQKARTALTVISMMVGAFLISIMLSVGAGLERFMISQVTLFANEQTISVKSAIDVQRSFGVGFGGGVQEFEESSPEQENSAVIDQAGGPLGGAGDTTASGMSDMMDQMMLTAEDLEKIRSVEHVDEAAFESFVTPDYVRLSDEGSKKLMISLYGMPQGYLEMLTFSVMDKSLFDNPHVVILSDGYAESWGKTNEELLGETVVVRVSRSVVREGEAVVTTDSDTVALGNAANETEEFEMTIAGFFEKNMFVQIGFVTPSISNEINAYVQNQPVDEFEKNEKSLEIVVLVDNAENVTNVDEELADLGYQSMTTDEAIGQIGVVFDVISAVLSSFGFVAMFVASIGIANTLLMAIYERTREIGVMKAVGATRMTIGLLFTAEAVWLGILGGVSGIATGWGVGRVANMILHNGVSVGGITLIDAYLKEYPTFDISVFSLSTIGVVMVVTVGVAFFAGLYPSLRAGRLDPIEALRHD